MWWTILLLCGVVADPHRDPARDQIIMYRENVKGPIPTMTTSSGAPIEYADATSTLNKRLLRNEYFMDSLTHLTRERIPERFVHSKGAGGFGYFEVTHNITHICKANFLNHIGKKTPVAVRFSPFVAERGGRETIRDARGFAIKFYTEEGNFDIVGFDTPVFAIKDPLLFTVFTRAQKRNPATNLFDLNTFWDFIVLSPETLHMYLMIYADRGIPNGYRNMPGFGIHTYELVNSQGAKSFVKFHFVPESGVEKYLTSAAAQRMAAVDYDFATRDLYRAIAKGDFPSWRVGIQVMTPHDAQVAGFDIFDVTLDWPMKKYPLHPVGRFVLNRNQQNYHADIEQLGFCVANLVPGILGSPDKLYEGRILAYRDTQNYRLGVNFNRIPVNRPRVAHDYNRDGVAPVLGNHGGVPNYYPNSFKGPDYYVDKNKAEVSEIVEATAGSTNVIYEQMRDLYENQYDKDQRSRLIDNIVSDLGSVVSFLQERVIQLLKRAHPDLGYRVEHALATNATLRYNYSEEPDFGEIVHQTEAFGRNRWVE